MEHSKLLLALCLLAIFHSVHATAKQGYSLLTPEEAAALKSSMKAQVILPQDLMNASDEDLWNYVPPASLIRAVFLGPTDVGCPVHGKEIFRVGGGFYPWKRSADNPWKVQCPVGGEFYPTNDFGAYIKGGMKEKLDTTKPYVDDGNGWTDEKGRRFFFVGYWVFWQRWYDVLKAIRSFSDAYFATGDEQYAHKATVLFCALAEQYPKMDYPKQGVQGCGGMILPWCWENQSVVTPMSECYDRLFPYLKGDGDGELRAFLKTKTDLGPRRQIEQKFIQTVAKINFTTDMYWSNECDHQLALATLALAWDNNDTADGITTKQMVDWIINNGGDNSLEELLFNSTYRDGFPCEGAIGYSASIAERQLRIAELLKKTGVDLFKQFPRLRQVAKVWLDMSLADGHSPSIGDAGSVLGSGRVWNAYALHLGWENYHDPAFTQALCMIQSFRKNPYSEDRTAEFEKVIKEHGEQLNQKTRNLGGMGLAMLESGGAQNPRGLALYYGCPAGGHAHHDRLNIEFFDHRQSMLPDLGYPDQWGAKAQEFTQNTVAHYGVLVDEKGEKDYMAGYLRFIKGAEGIQVVNAHAERCFSGTTLYERTSALIDVSPSACYVADVFRIRGGKQHDWSFHLPPVPEWEVEGVDLSAPQAKGSLAGDEVPVGAPMPAGSTKSGFNWLGNIQRGRPQGAWTFLSKVHPPYPSLRMTMLPGCAQEIIVGDHESPRIGQSLPPTMKWLLARNTGQSTDQGLGSVYASVIEACPEKPALQKVTRLETRGGKEPVAMRIEMQGFKDAGGCRDTILSDETGVGLVTVKDFGEFKGRWGFVREGARGVSKVALVNGDRIRAAGVALETSAAWTGQITRVDFERKCFDVSMPLPAGNALKGEWIVIHNAHHRTCYEVDHVESLPQGSRVYLTEVTPMIGKGYVDKVDEAQRLIHTDTRWRVYGKDEIWSGDFGPALTGYALMNEDKTAAFEIEDCKLMPSRARQWWKPEPAWIKVAGKEPFESSFKDSDGDGRKGFWVYDFRAGSSFTLANSVSLTRVGQGLWSVSHCGGESKVTVPCTEKTDKVALRESGGNVRLVAVRYDAPAKTATVTLPAGLRSPTVLGTRPTQGLNLTDVEPPTVRAIRVDGKAQQDAAVMDLFLSDLPTLIEVEVADAKNAIDPAGVRIETGLEVVYAGEPGVTVERTAGTPRAATVRIAPDKMIALGNRDAPVQISLRLTVDDVAVDSNQTVREFRIVLGPHIPEGSAFLSDINPVKAFAHAGVIRDKNYLGGEIRLGGAPYRKGLMVCPEVTNGPVNYGEAVYTIPAGKFKSFKAVIGIEDSAGGGSVKFTIQLRKGGGDWQAAFQSGICSRGTAPQSVSVPLGNADEIRLYTDANGPIDCDHAMFAAARLEP